MLLPRKGEAGLDQHQVRLWRSFHRHTVLSMCAQALLAIAAAQPAPPGSDSEVPRGAVQPAAWRDTGKLPASADDQPPGDDPGLVMVSVPEARRLVRLATTPITRAARDPDTPGPDGDDATRPAPDGTTTTPGSPPPPSPNPSRPKGGAHVTNPDCSTGRHHRLSARVRVTGAE